MSKINEVEREELVAELVAELKGNHPENHHVNLGDNAEIAVRDAIGSIEMEFADLYDDDGKPAEDVKKWFRLENFIKWCKRWADECWLPHRWAELGFLAFPELDLRGLKDFV